MSVLGKIDHIKKTLETTYSIAQSKAIDGFEIHCTFDQGHVVNISNQHVESLEFNVTQHLGITVYQQGKTGYAETSDLSYKSLQAVVESAFNIAHFTEKDSFSGIIEARHTCTPKHLNWQYAPWTNNSIDHMIDIAKECESYALSHKDIFQSEGVGVDSFEILHGFANSHGFMDVYPETRHSINAGFVAKDNHGMQRDNAYFAHIDQEQLPSVKAVAELAIQRTLAKRDPRHITTQSLPIILQPQIAKGFYGGIISAIKGSRQYHQDSFLLDSLNQQVISSHISMTENPHIKYGIGSRPYDDEGVDKGASSIIHKGNLQRYILNSYTARQLKLETTGNAGGISNIIIDSDQLTTHQALIKSMDKGIIIHEAMGQGINLTTGNYSQGAMGFYVENGQIQYPIDNFTISGQLHNMLTDIQAVADDIDRNSRIHCGSMLIGKCTISGE